jgi:hypothetical protein
MESGLIVIEEGFEAGELAAMGACCKSGQTHLRT